MDTYMTRSTMYVALKVITGYFLVKSLLSMLLFLNNYCE